MAMFLEGVLDAQGADPAAAGAGSGRGGTGRERAFIVPTPLFRLVSEV